MLYPLTNFIDLGEQVGQTVPTYWYEGRCPERGERLQLPRTVLVEAIAHRLMHQLAADPFHSCEGKMYGVLLVAQPSGEWGVLKAFSGLLNGNSAVEGWVPPIPGREQIALEEAHTLSQLAAIKQELIVLHHIPERQQHEHLSQTFAIRLHQLTQIHQQRKYERHQQRQHLYQTLTGEALATALNQLERQSQWDGIERRRLKQERDTELRSLKAIIEQADRRSHELKHQRRALSQHLQAQMQAAYCLTNFTGSTQSLQQIASGAMPTGTGDCCAPKLLHYAATQGLEPLAMAEFWWHPSGLTQEGVVTRDASDNSLLSIGLNTDSSSNKVHGKFYGACRERCQPLMGFLLSGLSKDRELNKPKCWGAEYGTPSHTPPLSLPIVYEDQWILVVDKPSGLLSVPGRDRHHQDSVWSRLRHQLANGETLTAVHRLDQDTSGILLLAKDRESSRQLRVQFQQRQIEKRYEAILIGTDFPDEGLIDLPLWADPNDRPYQKVDWQRGKPSQTRFRVMNCNDTTLVEKPVVLSGIAHCVTPLKTTGFSPDKLEQGTRVEFVPITGRTHQIRVHATSGLGAPIRGDRLYGGGVMGDRLYLHAREIGFIHPHSQLAVRFKTSPPF